jgi:hypothetical protein
VTGRVSALQHVSHQLVLVRNASHSFGIFNFGESSLSLTRSLYFFSGFSDVFSGFSWLPFGRRYVTAAKMPNRQAGSSGELGRFVQTLAKDVPASDEDACAAWIQRSSRSSSRCGRCPANHLQVLRDWRYSLFAFSCSSGASSGRFTIRVCYRGPLQCVRRNGFRCSLYQRPQCCYRLRVQSRSGYRYLRNACSGYSSSWFISWYLWQYRLGK